MPGLPRQALVWLFSLGVAGAAGGQSLPSASAPAAPPVTVDQPHAALRDAWASPEVVAPRLDGDLLRRPHPGRADSPGAPARNNGFGGVTRTSAALAGVLALILLLAWGYRAATGASGRLARRLRGVEPGLIQVLGRTSLGPRHALHLVRLGPQLVLVGATHDALRTLTVVQDAELAARYASQGGQRGAAAEFQTCLETEGRAYVAADHDEPGSLEDQARLGAVKHRLTEALRRLGKPAEPDRAAARGN